MRKQIGEKLYKLSSTGKVLHWSIFVDGNSYWSEHGQVDGTTVSDSPTFCDGKNIGRANETSPEEQAELEAFAKHKKKIDINGYTPNLDEVNESHFKVTLAHKFKEHGDKLPSVVRVSPKLDGIRCYINRNGAFSRNGKRLVSTKFIEEALRPFFNVHPSWTLDGELYSHALADNFNAIVSMAKKQKESSITDEEWDTIKGELKFYVFDAYIANEKNLGFDERYTKICADLRGIDMVEIVPQHSIHKQDFIHYYNLFMQDGYEGIMFRDPNAVYEMKRSYKLLKHKEFDSAEFPLVDVLEGVGNRAGMAGKLIVKLADGSTCETGLRGNEAYFTELLKNKANYIGKRVTVNYQGFTPDGKLRFGVAIAVRDYE